MNQRALIPFLICFLTGTFFCSAQTKKSILDIDMKSNFIEYSIKRIWDSDSLATDGGKGKITDFLCGTNFFYNYRIDSVINILGKPLKVTTNEDSSFDFIYVGDAIKYLDGRISNAAFLVLSFSPDSLVSGAGIDFLE